MQAATAWKWSFFGLTAAVTVVLGLLVAVHRGRYAGYTVDGQQIALVGARVYDPAGDSLIDRTTVFVRGRRIDSIDDTAPIPTDAVVLDVSGLTLLPGLIDSHVHLTGLPSPGAAASGDFAWLSHLWRFLRRFPDRRRDAIRAGVTTIKSLGDPYPWIVEFARQVDRHELAGPRVFAGGPMLTAPGGHPVARFRAAGQGDTSFIAQFTRQLADTADASRALRRLADDIDFVSAVLETDANPGLPRLAPDLLSAVVGSAHDRELRALVHVGGAEDVETALLGGADGIEHIPGDRIIDSATVALLRDRHVFVVPTLEALEKKMAHSNHDDRALRIARANVRSLHRAGVPIVAGSDAPNAGADFGRGLHEELRNLLDLGLAPGDAIASATSRAAEHLGLQDSVGTIQPGKWADIIGVEGDPLSDIRAMARIRLVIADGQILLQQLRLRQRPVGVFSMARPRPARAAVEAR